MHKFYIGQGWLSSLCLLLKAITPKYHHLGNGVGKHLNICIWEGVSLFSVEQVISPVMKRSLSSFLGALKWIGEPWWIPFQLLFLLLPLSSLHSRGIHINLYVLSNFSNIKTSKFSFWLSQEVETVAHMWSIHLIFFSLYLNIYKENKYNIYIYNEEAENYYTNEGTK